MIIMIDNYDSFTYNLVQYLEQLGARVQVFRNDAVTVQTVDELAPAGVVISPGPGRPEEAGVSMNLIRECSGHMPILGVCLGHQAIAAAFGGSIAPARHLMHGKTSMISADARTLFRGMRQSFKAMRYHSLAVSETDLPACFEISARSDDGEIMGIRHRVHPTEGIQFHPESIMTSVGKRILKNFLRLTAGE
jgi:anthranilate synthase/aminodeoxychorismate synthase-like glutamine amidotransferase